MNSTILISKNEIGNVKIAFLENYKLYNFEVENEENKFKKGNIFKGFITKIEDSLDALFIDYGATKDGFLSFKEISKDYLEIFKIYDGTNTVKKKNIALCKSFIIQIEKEETENKGATLTTYLHLAGFFTVLAPYSAELKGISKKILKDTRFELKKILNETNLLKNVGIILRTFGYGKNANEFKAEIFLLLSQLKLIKILYNNIFISDLIYECNNIIIKIIRDYIKFDVTEVIIDDIYLFNVIYKYLSITRSPNILSKIKLHTGNKTLFDKYDIQNQTEILFNREIFLTSGGSITIDTSEALTFIDVNSSKSNKCDDVTETALQTNLEAIVEIFKQLKIRDLNGLIIVDFIDVNDENFTLLEYKLKELIHTDKAKIQIEKISKFGLLEISREKIKTTTDNPDNIMCFKCQGNGKLQNINLLCLNLLDSIKQETNNQNIKQINIELPIKLANYFINIKRTDIKKIETKHNIKIIIVINEYLEKHDYKIYTYKKQNIIKRSKNTFKKQIFTEYFNNYNYIYKKINKN